MNMKMNMMVLRLLRNHLGLAKSAQLLPPNARFKRSLCNAIIHVDSLPSHTDKWMKVFP